MLQGDGTYVAEYDKPDNGWLGFLIQVRCITNTILSCQVELVNIVTKSRKNH